MAPCLAESWTESPDGLVYEFKLREGLRFHNGDPFTAEDVRFSFQRYRGASAKLLHDRVKPGLAPHLLVRPAMRHREGRFLVPAAAVPPRELMGLRKP